jgi:hypothetical protein
MIFSLPEVNMAQNVNLFNCITMQNETHIPAKSLPVIDYMVTVYPRNDNHNVFPFVYNLFGSTDKAFSANQDLIINLANTMFSNAISLNELEQDVLNNTYRKSIKDRPTLSGRK